MKNKKLSMLQVILTIIFTNCYVVSNIIINKPVQLPFGLECTGTILIFSLTYVLSDIFSEVYGYEWSRITSYLAFMSNIIAVFFFFAVLAVPAPAYWGDQQAFETVLGSSWRPLVASMLAYVAGDKANDMVFRAMKAKHEDMKGFGFRAILSSIAGQIVDTAIFIPVAFLGVMPLLEVLQLTYVELLLKFAYEIVLLPVTTFVTKTVLKAEKK